LEEPRNLRRVTRVAAIILQGHDDRAPAPPHSEAEVRVTPKLPPELVKKPAPPPPPPVLDVWWKCKPCGKAFTPAPDAADDEAVRCPNCNARLGLAGEFRTDPTPSRVRARLIRKS